MIQSRVEPDDSAVVEVVAKSFAKLASGDMLHAFSYWDGLFASMAHGRHA